MPIRLVEVSPRTGRLRTNRQPHLQIAFLFARFGDWTQQPDLVEARALDVLVAYNNRIPTQGDPVQVPVAQLRKNYRVLRHPLARLTDSLTARHIYHPEEIGRLVTLFVPAYVP
ncbi:MAG TPA: hypothetical protein VMU11_02325 [Verrucomicrobiae bacterium]|nr:hypothetical protein [Verrucomicrobiae bacterium]